MEKALDIIRMAAKIGKRTYCVDLSRPGKTCGKCLQCVARAYLGMSDDVQRDDET